MGSIEAEYRAVREAVGLLDRAAAGKLALRGSERFSWLQGMVSNDVRLLEQGTKRLLACVLNATGHVLTDLALVDVRGANPLASALGFPEPDFVLADLPRVTLDKIADLFDRYIIMEDVEIEDVSDRLGCFSLQGPRAADFWRPDANNLPERIRESVYAVEADHTGSGGCDLYFSSTQAETVREALREAGVVEVGAEAQEVLRVEAGIPRYGAELDESVIALEAGLGPTHISLTKGCYVGQEIIARIDSRGHTNRALTGLILSGALPVPGDKIYPLPTSEDQEPREVGRLTSVVASAPAAGGRPIALGYVRHEHRTPGTPLLLRGEAQQTEAEVVSLPLSFSSVYTGSARP
ncbi:MAG TPA: glycine cleavage T C-terminal barrel domain-containing protein [Chthonomonadaceae bacterium]|nr:glycine cleavage T C-terminal barrel domain-containing protein [Chthonomonadaceae bacterium]